MSEWRMRERIKDELGWRGEIEMLNRVYVRHSISMKEMMTEVYCLREAAFVAKDEGGGETSV